MLNATRILTEGDVFYKKALESIEQAKMTVAFMVYIWQDDEIGRRFEKALAAAAQRGVYVRLVVDAVGSLELPRSVIARLREAGVHVFIHHRLKIFRWQWLRFLIRRNHRKIIIVDETIAFTGGFNIMRECSRKFFGKARWLDIALVVKERALINPIMEQFEDACRRARHEKWAARLLTRTGNRVIFSHRGRVLTYLLSRYMKHRLLRAQKRIVIAVPYFVPYGFWRRVLKQKLRKGVRVEIILSERSDLPWIDAVSFSLAKRLQKKGARVFLYRGNESLPRFSHTKLLMIDEWVLTGSANFDYRSMVLNLETMLAFRHPAGRFNPVLNELYSGSRLAVKDELKGGLRAFLLKPFHWLL
ncbi:MAG TPA: phosphatidylserine/phosphatidylglycerophosphate/cardiolipin synthase family protein [Turneriella sp.]|nr:phosphatidylserine/phosphatidylglycerophosphate/cardiolipin synthase family protein [Turneriella sp.]